VEKKRKSYKPDKMALKSFSRVKGKKEKALKLKVSRYFKMHKAKETIERRVDRAIRRPYRRRKLARLQWESSLPRKKEVAKGLGDFNQSGKGKSTKIKTEKEIGQTRVRTAPNPGD